jgi:hypothetical protein
MAEPASGAPVVKKNPGGGRAFRNKMANKYLAESGEHKFHPASGDRSNIVLRYDNRPTYKLENFRLRTLDLHRFK